MAAHAILADLQSGRSPWWWTPIERRHEPGAYRPVEPASSKPRPALAMSHHETTTTTPMAMTAATTPARSVVSAYSKTRATRPVTKVGVPPPPLSHAGSIRDDESLTSCPAFGGVPNYMTPTLSASAKARARAHLQQQQQQQQKAAQEKPRFSFGLGQSIGSLAKSPFWKAGGGLPSSRVATPAASVAGGRHRSTRSISGLSVDSTVSMPAGLGRRPFK